MLKPRMDPLHCTERIQARHLRPDAVRGMLNLINIGAACQFWLNNRIVAPRDQKAALESLSWFGELPSTASGRSPIWTSDRK